MRVDLQLVQHGRYFAIWALAASAVRGCRMCQLLVENGDLAAFPSAPGQPFVSCDSMAALYQVLRIQARAACPSHHLVSS